MKRYCVKNFKRIVEIFSGPLEQISNLGRARRIEGIPESEEHDTSAALE